MYEVECVIGKTVSTAYTAKTLEEAARAVQVLNEGANSNPRSKGYFRIKR